MYYKTSKDSDTGKKLTELYEKSRKAHDTRNECVGELMEQFPQMTGKFVEPGGMIIAGGIHTVMFSKEPDLNVWVKMRENEYLAKVDTEVGQKIYNLPVVKYTEINKIFNHNKPEHIIGVKNAGDFFGIEIDPDWGVEMPEDCEEILGSEFYSL